MNLQEKMIILRKQKGLSQEELADKIGIARQTISKWETGQATPELSGLILLSEFYGVTIDSMVRDKGNCDVALSNGDSEKTDELIKFLLFAKKNTYAKAENQTESSRIGSHDFMFKRDDFTYYDTYIGGESFGGEEAVWHFDKPVWCMNYVGRVVDSDFNVNFLKEALLLVPYKKPFRGPEIYSNGNYHYCCRTYGDFEWFQGFEEIFYTDKKVYECAFHGGNVR